MHDIDEIINEATGCARSEASGECKDGAQGFSPAQICQVLNVSLQYVSKWKGLYEAEGGAVLRMGYRGSERYLRRRRATGDSAVDWGTGNGKCGSGARLYRRAYGVVYRSKQSYYELLDAGGMSYHRSEKNNPKRDEAQILARREEIKKNWHRTGMQS